jgi:hypothetical protein
MEYQIKNFKPGLDTRRLNLTSVPGTLETLENFHINQGGEVEKRYAYVPTSAVFANTFGGVSTPNGILVFGSVAAGTLSLPSGFVYQQLVHPDGATAMTSVVSQTLYGNFAWVIAEFADGKRFCYYNGNLVRDFTSGQVLATMTNNSSVAAAIADLVNVNGFYTSVQNTGSNANTIDIYSLPGNGYSSSVAIATKANITIATVIDESYTTCNVYASNGENATDGKLITIGSQAYRFKDTMAQAYDVKIGKTIVETVQNLYLAINAAGVAGTNYYTGTVANANVYAQNLILATNPSFQVLAFVSNIEGQVKNNLTSVAYQIDAPTVPKNLSVKAVGQFKINAILASTANLGSITIATTTVPTVGQTLTVTSFFTTVYTFKAAGTATSQNDVVIQSTVDLTLLALGAVINGRKTFSFSGVTYTASNKVGHLDHNRDVNAANVLIGSGVGAALKISVRSTTAGSATLTTTTTCFSVPASALSGGTVVQVTGLTIGPVNATGYLTTNGTNVTAGDTVTFGAITYTFKASLSGGSTYDVLIGGNANTSLTNLIQAINFTGIQNVDYIASNASPDVKALATLNGNVLQVNARVEGTQGNAIALSTTAASLTASGTGLTGGADNVSLLSSAVISLPGQTKESFAVTLMNAINSYTSTSGFYAEVIGSTVIIYSEASNALSNNADITVTTSGTIAIGFCGIAVNGNPTYWTRGMKGMFKQLQINGVNMLTKKHVLDPSAATSYANGKGTNTQDSSDTTVEGLVLSVCADMNATSSTYTAVPVGNSFYLTKDVTTGDDPPLTVVADIKSTSDGYTDGTVLMSISQIGVDNLSAVVTPLAVNFRRYAIGGSYDRRSSAEQAGLAAAGFILGGPAGLSVLAIGNSQPKMKTESFSPIVATCKPTGGYPPYKFQWMWVSGDNGFQVSDPNASSVTFSRPDNSGSNKAFWKCIVTDDMGNSVDSNPVQIYQP